MTRRLFLPVLAALLLWSSVAGAVSVQMTSPANGASYTAPANVTVSSLVELWEDGERLGTHKIYRNGAQIASGTRTLSTTVNGLPAGTHTFHSSATNTWGEYVQSTPVTITVVVPGGNPPTVTVSASAGSYIAPASVPLSASAADSDGHITRVEFYANGGHVGTDTAAPYGMTWGGAPAGNHSVTAKAFDNNGISTTSVAVGVTIAATTVTGHIEGVNLVGAQYSLGGWACSTGRNQSIDVHLYVGGPAGSGAMVAGYAANLGSEPAVAAACQAQGTAYRFAIPITAATRQNHANKKIYLHGISPDGQANLLIANSGTFSIPPPLSLSRKYVYDAHQQLCKTIEPETGATVSALDAAGNLQWSAAGLQGYTSTTECNYSEAYASGRRVNRVYDARNRLTGLYFPDGQGNQSWGYTPDGLPSQIITNNDTTQVTNAYAYNKRRMLTGESVGQSGWYTWGIGYNYDANGALAGQRYPTGLHVDYAPNALGQPTRAGGWATGVSYYPNGAIKQFTYGNGVVHTMEQNARQLPSRVTDAGAADFTYAFDANANPVTIRDVNAVAGAYSGNRDLQYDGLDRLTYAHLHYQMINNYRYDALDNLRRKEHYNGSTTAVQTYVYDSANRLSFINNEAGAATTAFEFDAQGNLRTKNNQSYSFDYGNRLRASSQEWYRYDGHGRRVLNWRGGEPGVLSQYSQSGQLVYDENYRASGRKASEHVYLGGSLIATRERNIDTQAWATKYQHTDALGSPVAVTNEAGQVVDRTHWEPYGASINKTVDGIGYTGHVMDSASGLTYMQQRYYDPTLGRFLSADPVTANSNTGANFNRYYYANNNPYKFTDPDGRAPDAILDAGFIIYDTGRFLGASAAAAVGAVTGNDALRSAGLEGMRETGADLGASVASAAVPGLMAPMARGVMAEARVLKDIGEVKNTAKIDTSQGRSIPDFQNAKQVGEIKDTQRVSNTTQVRAQREHAQATGREHTVVTGTNTKVSSTVEQQSTVVRRDDLGPQK
ncbi:RHS repeat-associated core domain-containing protein [Lysobacter koreensis]|uniref:RHS repeat-associated core domain-containing protein n=1 Tax=Lysobacter koreensis TaxID=266122 RepID=A0ABW2YNI1_9GAMM